MFKNMRFVILFGMVLNPSFKMTFKICNNRDSFHKDIESIKYNLIKNAYPPFLVDKVIKKHLEHMFSSNKIN